MKNAGFKDIQLRIAVLPMRVTSLEHTRLPQCVHPAYLGNFAMHRFDPKLTSSLKAKLPADQRCSVRIIVTKQSKGAILSVYSTFEANSSSGPTARGEKPCSYTY